MNKNIVNEFCCIVGKENVEVNVPMSKYTTFKVGGPADYLVTPSTSEQIKEIIQSCNQYKIKYYILGNGSNVLVRDSGFNGVIIKLHKKFSNYKIDNKMITAQAGITLLQLAKVAGENSLSGLEFASGIPGTLGGAVTMNAGAYNREMSQVLLSAKVLDDKDEIRTLSLEQLELGYRTSIIIKNKYTLLEATMKLIEGDKQLIQNEVDELMNRRREKQPLDYPSAGSTFKRPTGYFAGKLIMDAGLSGYRIGDACVSPKHCGFIINLGHATANDIIELIDYIKNKVYEKYQVILEPEVKILDE